MIALGLGVIYGLLGIINMAHGELVAIGAYTAVFVTEHGLPYWSALPIAIVLEAQAVTIQERRPSNPKCAAMMSTGVLVK